MGRFPSGQRGQTVNLLQIASVVRIHLCPCMRDCGGIRKILPQFLRVYGMFLCAG